MNDLFVDERCIDCGTCMWMAPGTFREAGGTSEVYAEPPAERHQALRAALACPTGSIHSKSGLGMAAAKADTPYEIRPGVFHMGYHDRASFGAASYYIAAEQALIDVPRWCGPVRNFLDRHGLKTIFLTHKDDIASHDKFAAHYRATRVMHEGDAVAGVERVMAGDARVAFGAVTAIPTPGHTRGSTCFLHGKNLFTGDHLATRNGQLRAFRRACWYDWDIQGKSMQALREENFDFVLPGHGAPGPVTDPKRAIDALLQTW